MREISSEIAEHVTTKGYSSVLAPSHNLRELEDRWVDIDVALTTSLRSTLDRLGRKSIKIYFPLIIPYGWLSMRRQITTLAGMLSTIPIDAVWLRVSNFKNDKSAASVRKYTEGAQTLLSSERPLIADHVGGLSGLSLLAMGSVGGLSHGIGAREGFRANDWQKYDAGDFGMRTRVYTSDLDLYFDSPSLKAITDNPAIRSRVGCKDKQCCPRGIDDMLGNARQHFVNSRFGQLARLGKSPESRRAGSFIRNELIPIGANLIKLDHALSEHEDLQRRIQKKRQFVDGLRLTLESMQTEPSAELRRSSIPRRIPYRPVAAVQEISKRPTI